MKKTFAFLVCIVMIFSVFSVSMSAADTVYNGKCGNDLTWELDTVSRKLTVSGTGAMTVYPFSQAPWYSYRSYVKTLVIGSGVTEISEFAFSELEKLESVEFADDSKLEKIGSCAFAGCIALGSIDIPSSVKTIDDIAFSECKKLGSVTFGKDSKLTYLGIGAFSACSNLKSIEIPEGVVEISSTAFFECAKLESVKLPASVKYIFDNAFAYCEMLKSVDIPKSVVTIAEKAFFGCESLKTVNFAANSLLKSIGAAAFMDCDSIVRVSIPNGVDSISANTFNGCHSLTTVTIPKSVKGIGNDAFKDCYKLVEVVNDSPLLLYVGSDRNGSVAEYAIEVNKGASKISNVDGCLFYSFSGANYLIGYEGEENELVLPKYKNGAKYEIYEYAFYKCNNITSVTMPDTVTKIGRRAFLECEELRSVHIPKSVKSIDHDAFNKCGKLDVAYIDSPDIAKLLTNINAGGELVYYVSTYLFENSINDIGGYVTERYKVIEKVNVEGKDYNCYSKHTHRWLEDTFGAEVCFVGKVCAQCSVKNGYTNPSHTYDDEEDIDCNECGQKRELTSSTDVNTTAEVTEVPSQKGCRALAAESLGAVLIVVLFVVVVTAHKKKKLITE